MEWRGDGAWTKQPAGERQGEQRRVAEGRGEPDSRDQQAMRWGCLMAEFGYVCVAAAADGG